MGFYVDPPDQSKESFLRSKGIIAPSSRISWGDVPNGFLPVVLVKNTRFTAAAICYSDRELDAFMDMSDPRSKETYFVRITELLSVTDPKFHKLAVEKGWVEVPASAT